MSMRRQFRVVALATLAIVAGSVAGCSSVPILTSCRVSIAALPLGSTIQVGEPLPAGGPLLVGPTDTDPTRTKFTIDSVGQATLDVVLRGDAIARFGAHTAGHIGESLAVAIDGRVAFVPIIQGPIPDGEIQLTTAGDVADLAESAAGCGS